MTKGKTIIGLLSPEIPTLIDVAPISRTITYLTSTGDIISAVPFK